MYLHEYGDHVDFKKEECDGFIVMYYNILFFSKGSKFNEGVVAKPQILGIKNRPLKIEEKQISEDRSSFTYMSIIDGKRKDGT